MEKLSGLNRPAKRPGCTPLQGRAGQGAVQRRLDGRRDRLDQVQKETIRVQVRDIAESLGDWGEPWWD